jgi:adenine-specific DNA-methyltransferase
MRLITQAPKRTLNKAFLKQRPLRSQMDLFKTELITLLGRIDLNESEEFHKNLVSDFLKKAIYQGNNFINTKGRQDLVIHNGKDNKTQVGVIIEAKRPNKGEWFTADKPNGKAIHELVLYYLRERIECNNIDIKYLVVTNINEWYIIEAKHFENLFYKNKALVKQYEEWRDGKKVTKDTALFYNEIAKPFIDKLDDEIPCTYFNIQNYVKVLKNEDKEDDKNLIALLKILSPQHLLKVPFANDSNELDDKFYNELLHIIGLEEAKENGKNIIRRKVDNKNPASFLEMAFKKLHTKGIHKVHDIKAFGETSDEQHFNIALELCITWINRILFLKLLEGQLINYHKGDKSYRFLNTQTIHDFDELFKLFHNVLAVNIKDREKEIQEKYKLVPYLNSSLFEISDLEDLTICIDSLDNSETLDFNNTSILKEHKKKNDKLKTLDYLFHFLDSYDFASEGSENIQEDNKPLINASVLGKVFEKINGYKDGSIYTPGFITMYMCRQSIRLAVVQKFNERKNWNIKSFEEIYNKIDDINEANKIINDIKICDPAVGSGHFLVSALNEIIAVKSELKILSDTKGKRLKEYTVEVENDELYVTDEEGEIFDYKPQNKESQLIQETLFLEKQTIIENCLFGVDINPNSVKICRLRLWIELLKNAYYKEDSNYTELETLPNIDINIKCGNSLLSRFNLKADVFERIPNFKKKLNDYKFWVNQYKNAKDRSLKKQLTENIRIFTDEFKKRDPKIVKLQKDLDKKSNEFYEKFVAQKLFAETADPKILKQKEKLESEINELSNEIEILKANTIYKNAFEWRFEFPEVLDSEGKFEGFDSIIANPPYVKVQELDHNLIDWYKENKKVAHKRIDISILFFELSQSLLKNDGTGSFISSNQFLVTEYGRKLREFLLNDFALISMIDYGDLPIFEDALTYVNIFNLSKSKPADFAYYKVDNIDDAKKLIFKNKIEIDITKLSNDNWVLSANDNKDILQKISKQKPLSSIGKCSYGIVSGADSIFIVTEQVIQSENLEPDSLLPLIRANNCKRYDYANFDLQIIYPFKHEDEATTLLSEQEFKSAYPNTFKYLLSKKALLEERKDSRKTFEDSNKWYSLTRFGQLENFKKTKIVFPGEQKVPKFSIDSNQSGYSGARVFGITITNKKINLKYLLAILNSKVIAFVIHSTFPVKAGGYYSSSSTFVDKLPIIQLPADKQKPLIELVDKILEAKRNGNDTATLEAQVDEEVYKLYELTKVEQLIIETSLAKTM